MEDAATTSNTLSFSRQFRLTNPAEFTRVFNNAQRSTDRYFTVLYRSNELPTARLGFAVAKKRVSAAVGRNRIRRLARESFRKQRDALPPVDIIILAQSAAAKVANKKLFASLEMHWQRLQSKPDQAKRSGRKS